MRSETLCRRNQVSTTFRGARRPPPNISDRDIQIPGSSICKRVLPQDWGDLAGKSGQSNVHWRGNVELSERRGSSLWMVCIFIPVITFCFLIKSCGDGWLLNKHQHLVCQFKVDFICWCSELSSQYRLVDYLLHFFNEENVSCWDGFLMDPDLLSDIFFSLEKGECRHQNYHFTAHECRDSR